MLWQHDQCAEALALRQGAFDEAIAAARALVAPERSWEAVCAALNLPVAEVAALEALRRSLEAAPLPVLDAQVGAAEEARHAALVRAHNVLDRAVAGALGVDRALRVDRLLPAVAVAAVLAVVAVAVVLYTSRTRRTALASAHLALPPGFPPSKAIDGDPVTEWLLPHGQTGWIEVQFARPRGLRAVRLLNAHNRTFNDLATRDYRIEAFAGDRLLGVVRGSFAAIDPTGPWVRHPLVAEGVTRVRVWVDSFHGATGGLGEIEVE